MTLKKFQNFLNNEKCDFCKTNLLDVLYGPIYKSRHGSKSIVVHYFCMLMASKIEQNGRDNQGILGFFPKDIMRELTRGSTQKCSYCFMFGATIHCVSYDCDKVFHLPCGVEKGSIHQFFNLFDSFCHSHRPTQSVPKGTIRNLQSNCIICTLKVDKQNKFDCLWPACCKPHAFLHRRCVQSMADNAGYYFKCPFCNNAENFKNEMKRMGVYIPEQEASWESEPHAYAELLVRGSGCEAKSCSCPQGRTHSKKSSGWQLELCRVCGGNGVHLTCSGRWVRKLGYQFNWFCEICKPVYLEQKTARPPENSSAAEPVVASDKPEDSNHTNEVPPESSLDTNTTSTTPILRPDTINNNTEETVPSTSSAFTVVSEDQISVKESEEEDVIVVSEDETFKPSLNLTVDVSDCETSDDDCLIVNVIKNKRRKRGGSSLRKKFRTAKWVPPDAISKFNVNGVVKNNMSNIDQPVSSQFPLAPAPQINVTGEGSDAAVTDESKKLPSQCHQKAGNLIQYNTSELSTISLETIVERGLGSSPSTKRSRNSVRPGDKNESEATASSKMDLKLNEISISRIAAKVPTQKCKEEIICNQVINLSSDDEESDSKDKIGSKGSQDMLDSNKTPEVFLNILPRTSYQAEPAPKCSLLSKQLNEPLKPYTKKNEKSNLTKGTLKNHSHKASLSDWTNRLLSRVNHSVIMQVVLSSDEEEEKEITPSTSKKKPSVDLGSQKKPLSPTYYHKNKVVDETLLFTEDATKNVVAVEKKTVVSDSIEELSCKSSSNSPGHTVSFLPEAFSIIVGRKKNSLSTLKADVLIVSDDDEDEIKNVYTSDQYIPGEPVPPKEFPSDEMCAISENLDTESSNEEISTKNSKPLSDQANPLKTLPSDYNNSNIISVEHEFPFLMETPGISDDNSCRYGIITEVRSLRVNDFDENDDVCSAENSDLIAFENESSNSCSIIPSLDEKPSSKTMSVMNTIRSASDDCRASHNSNLTSSQQSIRFTSSETSEDISSLPDKSNSMCNIKNCNTKPLTVNCAQRSNCQCLPPSLENESVIYPSEKVKINDQSFCSEPVVSSSIDLLKSESSDENPALSSVQLCAKCSCNIAESDNSPNKSNVPNLLDSENCRYEKSILEPCASHTSLDETVSSTTDRLELTQLLTDLS